MENSINVKGAEYARDAIGEIATNPNHSARLGIAKAAVKIGNYTDEAKTLWKEYIAIGCPINHQQRSK